MRLIGFAGYSGSGKTTLIERLVPLLVRRGLRISIIKHAHHAFDIDKPGKDSFRHREAGASEVLVTSGSRWALMHELRGMNEPTLKQLVSRMSPCDLVLVEGFKHSAIPKIEVRRSDCEMPFLFPRQSNIVALATDVRGSVQNLKIPCLDLNNPSQIVDFVLACRWETWGDSWQETVSELSSVGGCGVNGALC